MSRNPPPSPDEKPFPPFPTWHPVLPPDAPENDPGRDVPVPEHGRPGNGVHPHEPEGEPLEDRPVRDAP